MAAKHAAEQTAIDQSDDNTCRGYGAQPGSDTYVACRMNLANNREAERERRINASLELMGAGAAMIANSRQ
jgi:hypothetical protein